MNATSYKDHIALNETNKTFFIFYACYVYVFMYVREPLVSNKNIFFEYVSPKEKCFSENKRVFLDNK